ncbi:Signal transduction histidine kinase [Luteibacter sp. UNCMF331Sha3.1]|uniref:ATP-binding protein n=1 Tax=Luteibacter sp. UNCMF331Sha3.1 TaxID=1502760 RepID=UPI0008D64789|nr:ATP-binding protein [Luteibacter sp. UNCMF331Sha3.1]SEN44129.1 Signal transduction histidine kinase [Luteibacter sp. UNCMF331Sha3.1]
MLTDPHQTSARPVHDALRVFVRWLRDVPVDDPVERRHAPVLQFLMLFILATVPANWCYHLAIVRTPMRRDVMVDVGVDVLVWGAAALALWLIRRGALRRATLVFTGAMLVSLTTMYLSIGLTRQLLDQTYPVLTIVLGGLVLGRRELWTIYLLLMAMFCVGGLVDVVQLSERAYPRPWIGAANLPSLAISYFAITFVVDRCVAALRGALDESRRLTRALAASNATLRDEMAAREHAQENLLHAQKMETVGRLAGGVAHDFNNVLAVIEGYTEQARDAHEPERLRESVRGIAAAAQRGAAVSRKLLSFSRRETIRPEVFDVRAAMREIAPMLRQLFGDGHRVKIDDTLDASTHVCIDRGQLELSLLNIAANARDAMAAHGRFGVTLSALRHADTDGLLVELHDDGEGMTEATRQRIFEPYFTTKPAGSGTGLGLAVVRDAFNAVGGWVDVASEPGVGTHFRLWLPVVAPPEPAQADHAAVRVLLVEDDGELRDLLLDALDEAGCVAIATDNAVDARRILCDAGDSLEVVVSDCHLPGTEHGRLGWLDDIDLPIVLISASVDAEARRLQDAGRRVSCLPKPFAAAALVERVRRMAATRQASMT